MFQREYRGEVYRVWRKLKMLHIHEENKQRRKTGDKLQNNVALCPRMWKWHGFS